MSNRIHSNAFNFDSSMNAGVDPRTGQFSCSVDLVSLTPYNMDHDGVTVTLSYDPLSPGIDPTAIGRVAERHEEGFGHGWKLNLSTIEIENHDVNRPTSVNLHNGTSFEIEGRPAINEDAILRDNKIENIRVRRISPTRFEIWYKNGIVETLDSYIEYWSGRDPLAIKFRCTQIRFPNGEFFTIRWHANRYVLMEITSNIYGQVYLSAVVDGRHRITNYRYPIENGFATVIISYRNGGHDFGSIIQRISLPSPHVDLQQRGHYFQYVFRFQSRSQSASYCLISRYENPLGSHENISYHNQGHQVSNNDFIPAVSQHEIWPGGPANHRVIQKRYSYSTNNFMGFDRNAQHQSGTDNLYLRTTTYNYESTETLTTSNNIILEAIHRTYNRFHLLTNEVTTRGICRTTKRLDYNEITGVNFFGQPGNLQFPRSSQVTFRDLRSGTERTETELMETDNFGNVLSSTDSSGVTKRYAYFPAAGTPGQCPADPLRFSRFLRELRVSPAGGITPVAPDKVIAYTYESFPGAPNVNHRFIARVTERINGISVTNYTYLNGANSWAGLILSENHTINNFTTQKQYHYRDQDGNRITTTTTTGFDRTATTEISARNLHTGNEVSFTDVAGVRKRFEYDALGHMSAEILELEGGRETRRVFILEFRARTFVELTIEPTGQRYQEEYDGMSRLIRVHQLMNNDPSQDWLEHRSIEYNELSQMTSEIERTRVRDSGASSDRIVSNRTGYSYDGWGNVADVQPQLGRRTVYEHNPIANTVLTNIWNRGSHRSHLNRFGEEERVEFIFNTNPPGGIYSVETATYDGFGRIISETDAEGNTTRFGYDEFDRITSKIMPDGTSIAMIYAGFSYENYIESISVNNILFGSLQYDGLGRVIRSTVGGRTTQFNYARPGDSKPTRITAPDGSVREMTYNRFLQDALTRIQTAGMADHTISYDNVLSTMEQAQNDNQTTSYSYDRDQNHIQETARSQGFTRSATHQYSSSGMLQSIQDPHANIEGYFYDPALPRLIRTTKRRVTTTYTYDGTSENLSHIRSLNSDTGRETTIQFVYDDFLRENVRIFSFLPNAPMQVNTFYNRNNQIVRRNTTQGGSGVLTQFFEYDRNSRLTVYHTQGTLRPTDHTGRSFWRQNFSYDQWGNITTLITQYNNGPDETTTYTYDSTDPTQLVSITTGNSNPITLEYDANGRLIRDEKGQQLIYNNLDQLIRVNNPDGTELCTYFYDAQGNLIEQQANGVINRRLYTLGELSNMQFGDNFISYINGAEQRIGQTSNIVGQNIHVPTTTLFGNDIDDTLRVDITHNNQTVFAYTPYGYRHQASLLPGFIGAIVDPVTGWYFLGNGYRVYNPILMRFHTPDSWSPFGAGGINPYIYANGDPINSSDPSGHMSTGDIVTVTVAAVSLALTLVGGIGIVVKGVAVIGRFLSRIFRVGRKAKSMAKVMSKAASKAGKPKVSTLSKVNNTLSVMSDTLSIVNIVVPDERVSKVLTYVEGLLAGGIGIFKGIVRMAARSSASRVRTTLAGAKGTISKKKRAKKIAGTAFDIGEGLLHGEAFTMNLLDDFGVIERNDSIELSDELIEYIRAGGNAGGLGVNLDINFAVDPGNVNQKPARNSLQGGRAPITGRRTWKVHR
ncbi:hypothetical protein B0A69_00055 [Chryseobacterium shigense]|nr:RHS repeat-associated core domain-containing protein [Chryseobacterium shigense]PQA97771.1 hypothetical protein B0A69_00055 [Chryseobacterium shigense]